MTNFSQAFADEIKRANDALDYQNDLVAIVDGEYVTRGALSQAFDSVKDSKHWKNPIDRVVTVDTWHDIRMIQEAVKFFAGCVARTDIVRHTADGKIRVHVQAPGYYLSVGA